MTDEIPVNDEATRVLVRDAWNAIFKAGEEAKESKKITMSRGIVVASAVYAMFIKAAIEAGAPKEVLDSLAHAGLEFGDVIYASMHSDRDAGVPPFIKRILDMIRERVGPDVVVEAVEVPRGETPPTDAQGPLKEDDDLDKAATSIADIISKMAKEAAAQPQGERQLCDDPTCERCRRARAMAN